MQDKQKMKSEPNKVTVDMLKGLSSNICNLFNIVYPDGLEMEELKEQAKNSNIYRIVLQHVQKR